MLQPKNTLRAYRPKIQEWKEYCEARYKNESGFLYGIKPERLLPFMFYQSFREKRACVGGGRRTRCEFNVDDFDYLMSRYKDW
jgi:hypothetical protein